jgi:hypothetical protein
MNTGNLPASAVEEGSICYTVQSQTAVLENRDISTDADVSIVHGETK